MSAGKMINLDQALRANNLAATTARNLILSVSRHNCKNDRATRLLAELASEVLRGVSYAFREFLDTPFAEGSIIDIDGKNDHINTISRGAQLDLYRADPHKWGPGKVHYFAHAEHKRTLCGRRIDQVPARTVKGTAETVSCKVCKKVAA